MKGRSKMSKAQLRARCRPLARPPSRVPSAALPGGGWAGVLLGGPGLLDQSGDEARGHLREPHREHPPGGRADRTPRRCVRRVGLGPAGDRHRPPRARHVRPGDGRHLDRRLHLLRPTARPRRSPVEPSRPRPQARGRVLHVRHRLRAHPRQDAGHPRGAAAPTSWVGRAIRRDRLDTEIPGFVDDSLDLVAAP